MVELIPPSVQTDLMPGYAEDPKAMSVADFISETMAPIRKQPTPQESKVKTPKFPRYAKAEGWFEQTLDMLNATQ